MAVQRRKRSNRVTLADVSRLAGCSTAVASTVINKAKGNTGVSPEMVKRVRSAAAELGYRADFASQSLARRTTQTLGVYVPPAPWAGIGYSYEGKILRGVEAACRARGYDLLVINLGGDGSPDDCLDKFAQRRIDGLVLVHVAHDEPWVAPLMADHANIVAVNYYGNTPGLHAVNFDDARAARVATEHLIQQGHRRIGYIGPLTENPGPGAEARRRGFMETMARHGLEVDPRCVICRLAGGSNVPTENLEHQDTGQFAGDYLAGLGDNRPTACVAYSDYVAIQMLRQFQILGVRVPEQMSVIGIDDSELCGIVWPRLSSVKQPLEEMGFLAAESLIRVAAGESASPADLQSSPSALNIPEPEIVVRDSTGELSDDA